MTIPYNQKQVEEALAFIEKNGHEEQIPQSAVDTAKANLIGKIAFKVLDGQYPDR